MREIKNTLKSVAAGFEGSAKETILRENFGKHIFEIRQILRLAGKKSRVLDVGGGMGINLITLARLAKGLDLHLVDNFDEYDKEGVSRMGRTPQGLKMMEAAGIKVRRHDIILEKLPFQDDCFDVVTCFDVVEHLPRNPLELFAEIKRVLKPGGVFLLGAPNAVSLMKIVKIAINRHPYMPYEEWTTDRYYGHFREYTCSEYMDLLARSGLEKIKARLLSEPTRTRAISAENPIKKLAYFFICLSEILLPRLRPSVYCIGTK